MGDFIFVIKALVMAVVLIVFMQIKVGSTTLEEHSVSWIQRSSLVEGLRGVASGAITLGEKAYLSVRESEVGKAIFGPTISWGKAVKDQGAVAPEEAHKKRYTWQVRRSEAYYKQVAKEGGGDESAEDGPMGDEVD